MADGDKLPALRSPMRPGPSNSCDKDTDHARPWAVNEPSVTRFWPTERATSGFAHCPADLRPAFAAAISAW
jgi:hypothetical protein